MCYLFDQIYDTFEYLTLAFDSKTVVAHNFLMNKGLTRSRELVNHCNIKENVFLDPFSTQLEVLSWKTVRFVKDELRLILLRSGLQLTNRKATEDTDMCLPPDYQVTSVALYT